MRAVGRPVRGASRRSWRERLILYGALSSLQDGEPVGVALAVQARERDAVDALLDEGRVGLNAFRDVEIHDWDFGGRR